MSWRGIGWGGFAAVAAMVSCDADPPLAAPRLVGWALLGVAVALVLWIALALLLARRDPDLDLISRLQFLCPIRREWVLEVGGRPVARICDPVFTDMFWRSYRVVPLLQDPAEADRLFQIDFWYGGQKDQKIVARHAEFDLIIDYCLISTSESPPHIAVRSLPELLPRWRIWKLRRRMVRR